MSLIVFETAAPRPTPPQSAVRRLLEVPHRLYFSAGILAVLTLAACWAVRLAAPAGGGHPALLVHALPMPLGVFPLFMLGFIFTAGPASPSTRRSRSTTCGAST